MQRTGIFLQVRLNSTRMPGKALINLGGKKLIEYTIERMNNVPADVRVILTTKEAKKYLTKFAKCYNWEIFCGDSDNVLKRFVDAASYFKVDTIIRATGDNPLLSYEIANETLDLFSESSIDLSHISNVPYGSGVEIVKTKCLIDALQNSTTPYHFEHVTPYIYENNKKYKILIQDSKDVELRRKDVKISVDTRDDFERVNYLIREIKNNGADFSIRNIIRTYDKLNLNNYKRILYIINDQKETANIQRAILLAKETSNKFQFFLSVKDQLSGTLDNTNLINYNELESFVINNGIFDRVFIDKGNTSKKEMAFYKKLGFCISIDDQGNNANFYDITLNSSANSNKNLLYNFDNYNFSNNIKTIICILENLSAGLNYCPHCSAYNNLPVYRTNLWNLFYCKKCGLYYLIPLCEYNDIYIDKYFTDEYKEQYGKTYEEDKENILKFANKRLNNIMKFKKGGKLLDFGSGLGFFAELSQEKGFDTTSVDISDYAVNYIQKKLKLKAVKGDQSFFEKSEEKFDVITSFYVIEHIKDFNKLLFLFCNHLNKNGILALSTPNASGVSLRFNFLEYCKVHPKDHYRIFSTSFLKKLLRSNKFKKIKIVTTGIHPGRFIKSKKLLGNKIFYKFIYSYMSLFKLGDTFEIYAQKK